MTLKTSKTWIVCVVSVLGLAASSAVVAAPVVATPVTIQAGRLAPENVDGSKASNATQNKIASISKKYTDALRSGDSSVRSSAFDEMKSLYAEDSKNLALITWLGFAALQEGQPQAAVDALSVARGKSKSAQVNASNDRNLAVGYYRLKRYRDVVEVLGNNLDNLDGEALLLLASSQMGDQNYRAAAATYAKMDQRGLLSAAERGNYAVALTKSDSPDAQRVLLEAVKADPSNAPLLFSAASSLLSSGKAAAASDLLESGGAGLSSAGDVASLYARALARVGTKDSLAKAALALDRAGSQAELDAKFDVGTAALKANEFAMAIKYLKDLGTPEALNNLGKAYEGTEDMAKAAAAYGAASDHAPTDKLFARNAAMTYAKVHQDDLARKYAERAGDVPTTQFDLARIQGLVSSNKLDDALFLMNEMEPQFTNSAPFYFNKGVVLQKKGAYEKAVEAYRKSKAISDEAATIKNLTIALFQSNDLGGARLEADAYIGKVGRRADALQNLGAVLAAQGKSVEAINVWRELLKLEDNTAVRLDLGDALWNSGDTQGARFHYAAVLKVDPRSARSLNGMGLYLLSQSKLKDAESYFRNAKANDPGLYPAYYNLGIALERQNRVAEAKAAFNEALSVKPDFAEAKRALDRLNNQG